MKTSKKLSFEELERELSLENSPFEKLELLSEINGGVGGTVDDYIIYFQSLGFKMTIDNDGNYHYDRGYDGPPIIPGNYAMTYQNMYGSYFTYNPWVSLNNGGWVIYAPPVYSYSYDPWPRDSNGNIIMTYTNNMTYNYGIANGLSLMKEYNVTLNGYTFKLYEVDLIYDYSIGYRKPTPNERYNCFGYAAGLDNLWFADNMSTSGDEAVLNFDAFLGMFYEQCSESEADMIVLYEDTSMHSPYHAAVRNSNGTFSYKEGGGKLTENVSYSTFRNDEKYSVGPERYYKLK
ncbi:hypothetical protein [Sphingobacterium sp.]|uniref:DUF7689 domain-containing protein n=1 Tax=Sphingobacterium sp. TaxID=341027 RepID=UPI002898EC14|nr:hypothetical protein [Sphingobacterium sp.]